MNSKFARLQAGGLLGAALLLSLPALAVPDANGLVQDFHYRGQTVCRARRRC